MTFLIYTMLVKIYCEMVGNYADLGRYVMFGFLMWLVHCLAKYISK